MMLHVPDEVRADPASYLRDKTVCVICAEELPFFLRRVFTGGSGDPLRAAVRDGIVSLLVLKILLHEKTAGLHVQVYAVHVKSVLRQFLLKRSSETPAVLQILDLLLSRQALHMHIKSVRDFF